MVSWSARLSGYLLQKNDREINSNTWTTLTNATTIQAGRYRYVEPLTNSETFYRLVSFR